MLLAVFGSTGLVGTALTALALDRGHEVRTLVRGPRASGCAAGGVEVVEGDALDPHAVAKTVVGCDAVLSALGGYRGTTSLSGGTANILTAMRDAGVGRLVCVQGFHLRFPGDPFSVGALFVTAFLRVRAPRLVPQGHAMGALLRETHDIDWTLLRIPLVTPGPASGRAWVGQFKLGPRHSVQVGDVAAQMLGSLEDRAAVHTAPMIYTAQSS